MFTLLPSEHRPLRRFDGSSDDLSIDDLEVVGADDVALLALLRGNASFVPDPDGLFGAFPNYRPTAAALQRHDRGGRQRRPRPVFELLAALPSFVAVGRCLVAAVVRDAFDVGDEAVPLVDALDVRFDVFDGCRYRDGGGSVRDGEVLHIDIADLVND